MSVSAPESPVIDEPDDPVEMWTCPNCGEAHTGMDASDAQRAGGDLCSECAVACDCCENDFSDDSLTTVGSGRRARSVCEDCRDEHYFRCDDCGDWEHNDNSCNNSSDESVCESCGEYYFYCESCHSTCHQDDYGEDGECADCVHQNESKLITDYSFEPKWTERHHVDGCKCRSARYLGIELEVESSGDRDGAAEAVNDALNGGETDNDEKFAVLSEDGSLQNGFEIRTQPATLEYHRGAWKAFWTRKFPKLRSHDGGRCGLHVHVSRASLTELSQAKLAFLMHAPQWRSILTAIARREGCRFAAYDTANKGDKIKKAFENSDRYEVLNWSDKTVEFRLFRGTLVESSFWIAVEFADAICAYASSLASIQEYVTPDAFIRWLLAGEVSVKVKDGAPKLRHPDYPNLAAFVRNWKAN